jgi:amidase
MTSDMPRAASEIACAVRDGTHSAAEITEAHLAQIDRVNPQINAIAQEMDDAARRSAQDLDARRAAGEPLGPLAGVPVTIKVNVDQAGQATTKGLRLQRDLVAQTDSPVVANLRKAGAVIVGRTNTPAFSIRWLTNNALHGQTLNPRNAALTPGGSSGGAAAAVAAGLCAIGHGTDIAGSIRYPAYACGIHGLRPSHGRVPARNATGPDRMIGAQLMAVSGPLARSIADLRLAFEAMAAPVKDALRAAAHALEAAGWQVEELPCPPMRRAAEINATLWMAETALGAAALIAREGDPDSQFVFAQMQRLAGPLDQASVMAALQERTALMRDWATFLARHPLLLCPVSGELPFEQQSDVRSETDFDRIYEAQLTQRGLPVMGMPSLAVATGLAGAAPMGVQLVCARFREDILFDAGAMIEAASPPVEIA